MRLISQDGTLNFPYEQIVVQRDDSAIYARIIGESKARNVLANYSNEEKADRAMKMLREAYEFPQMDDGINLYLGNTFQFPADDEVKP